MSLLYRFDQYGQSRFGVPKKGKRLDLLRDRLTIGYAYTKLSA